MIIKNKFENTKNNNLNEKLLSNKQKVDINILLNRVRADKKKEKIESAIFISLISFAVIVSGVVLSFR
tara:strand:+ start:68 stop:271 length:204 start_codon:yes stop_codon:yes gene_type:complete